MAESPAPAPSGGQVQFTISTHDPMSGVAPNTTRTDSDDPPTTKPISTKLSSPEPISTTSQTQLQSQSEPQPETKPQTQPPPTQNPPMSSSSHSHSQTHNHSHTRRPSTSQNPDSNNTSIIPLDSPQRINPITPEIPSIKLPLISSESQNLTLNPLTLQPFTEAELSKYNFEKVREEVLGFVEECLKSGTGVGIEDQGKRQTEEVARGLREEAIRALKERLDEREQKIKEIQRLMDEKEKIREIERRVYRKKMGAGVDGGLGVTGTGGRSASGSVVGVGAGKDG